MDEPKRIAESCSRFALPAVLVAGAVWWTILRLYTNVTLEDALITFRYAQNLASGDGFVFNAGERVLGTTTPLLTMLLAFIGMVFGVQTIPLAASILMPLLGLLAVGLSYMTLREFKASGVTALLCVVLLCASKEISVTAVGGMETPMVLFFMSFSAYCLVRGWHTLALVACSLLILTRIDGVIWSSLVGTAIVIKERRLPIRPILAGVFVQLPWLIFAVAYFGSVLPHSIAAKQAIGGHLDVPLFSWASMVQFIQWYSGCSGWNLTAMLFPLWAPVLCVGVFKLAVWPEQQSLKRILILYPCFYGVFLYVGNAPSHLWYLVPPLWACLLVAAVGVEEAVEICAKYAPTGAPSVIKGLVVVVVVGGFCAGQNYYVSQKSGILSNYRTYMENELGTRKVIGLWLRDNTPVESVVLMEAIGYQGFYSRRRVIDLAGLVSPSVVSFHKESGSNAEAFHKIVSQLDPDYVVLRASEVDDNMHYHGGPLFEAPAQRDYFLEHYEELKRFTAPHPQQFGSDGYLTVFGKRPANPILNTQRSGYHREP